MVQHQAHGNAYRKVLHDEGTGIYAAMNIGIENACGLYCWFINSGDQVLTNSIPKLLRLLGTGELPWIIGQGKFDWRNPQKLSNDNLIEFCEGKEGGFISHQTVIVRTNELKKQRGFNPRYRVAADTDLILKLAKKNLPNWFEEEIALVQKPVFAAKFNRRGRFETLLITIKAGHFRAAVRIMYREFLSLLNRGLR